MSLLETTRTFRGTSVEELLPRIREELGPDAIVVRRRDGIVGGIGGFFGRRLVEIDAAPRAVALSAPVPVWPPASIAAAYAATPTEPELELEPDVIGDLEAGPLEVDSFAMRLAAIEREETGPPIAVAAVDEPSTPSRPPRHDIGELRRDLRERLEVADRLVDAGLPPADVERLVRSAVIDVKPFSSAPFDELVRRVLHSSIRVLPAWSARQRTVLLAGLDAAGVAEVAASLAAGYARAGLTVGLLGLDGLRPALALAEGTADVGVRLAAVDEPDEIERARERLGACELTFAVAPSFAGDRWSAARLSALVAALGKTHMHVVLPAGIAAPDATSLFDAFAAAAPVKALLPCDLDDACTIGGLLSLALRRRLPIAWVAGRDGAEPVDATALVRRVLP